MMFSYLLKNISVFQTERSKATVLLETIHASFEMDEILYELKDHSAGLNCGRWDYIFSFLKGFRNHNEFYFQIERKSR